MHFRIIEDEAPGLVHYRAARLLFLGGALLFFVPALLLVSFGIFVVIASLDGEASSAITGMSVSARVSGVAVMLAFAVPLLLVGRKLILGKRRLVLFLRRFGQRGGLATVSRAAAGELGSGIRLVTLDDRSITGSTGDSKSLSVTNENELEAAVIAIRRLTRRLRSPRRVFLEVADPIWQNVVLRLVAEANAVLIDVTEPGPSLLWEIETVGGIVRPRWVLVGEREALKRLADLDVDGEPTAAAHLAGLLRGEEVLAYGTGPNGRNFGHTLRTRYELVTRWPVTAPGAGVVTADAPGGEASSPPSSVPYELDGPPAQWWPGRNVGLPADGPGSLASTRERISARSIDVVLAMAVILALLGVEATVRAVTDLPRVEEGDWLSALVGLPVVVWFLGYDPLWTHFLGATPGKRAFNLQVVRIADRRPAGVGLVGARGMIQVLFWCCCVAGVLDSAAMASDPLRQTWHDRAVRTLVVRSDLSGGVVRRSA